MRSSQGARDSYIAEEGRPLKQLISPQMMKREQYNKPARQFKRPVSILAATYHYLELDCTTTHPRAADTCSPVTPLFQDNTTATTPVIVQTRTTRAAKIFGVRFESFVINEVRVVSKGGG